MSATTKKLQYNLTFYTDYDEQLKEQVVTQLQNVFDPHIKAGTVKVKNKECITISVIEEPERRTLEK